MAKEDLVKIIPRPKPKTSKYVYLLLWSALILLMVLFGGFFFFRSKTAEIEIEKEKLRSQLIVSSEQRSLENRLSLTSEQIKDFPTIFKKHQGFSKIFDFLSALCHPKVQFISLQLTAEDYHISLAGETESFQTLSEQIIGIEQSQEIKSFDVSNISLNREGKVDFFLNFTFSKDLIKE